MKVYIHTDIEGVAGWVFYATLANGSMWNYYHTQRMNALLTAEVNAAATAAKDAGATQVWVNDSHGPCYNILFEQLDPICEVIHGRPGYGDAWLGCFDGTVDALVAIGMHAMAGTLGGVCAHGRWHVNGDQYVLSECTMAAALGGTCDVPMVFASGDDKLCAEVQSLIPECEVGVVKHGVDCQTCRTVTPERARQIITDGVRRGVERREAIPPLKIPGPYRLNLSDRDPSVMAFDEDVAGDDLWETMHRAVNKGYGHYGEHTIDDKTWRYPQL